MKKTIREVIVVEGKDDISAVKNAVDAEVIEVNGFAVKKKTDRHKTIERIKVAEANRGIIILTDPDYAGEEIRKYIKSFFPNAKDAYIRRCEGTKNGDIGVENASPEAIINALECARYTLDAQYEELFSVNDLVEYGLMGDLEATKRREIVGAKLGIGYSNGKQFLSRLNRYGITKDEFLEAIGEIK